MLQILQSLENGDTTLAEVPCPRVASGQLLIRTSRSLVSAGTERMLVDFGKANLLSKARQQPDKVKQVLEKVKTDGLAPTVRAVRNKLDQSIPLGYCNVGMVLAVGSGVEGFTVGDRVASNGNHTEVVAVPQNLCVKVPDGVPDDSAAFTVIGAIALQGIRLVGPTLGETVVVTGLGLIGLVTVQLLIAQGCRVLGIDFDEDKLALARGFGAQTVSLTKGEDPVAAADTFSRGRGVDAVILTLAAKSSEPVSQAARMCRKRGRIVLVGVTGLDLSRDDFFKKELSFQVSCSYGPGRYDPNYEDKGQDYPLGYVRWTEQRNFEAVLDLLASGAMDVQSLISHRFGFDRALDAYDLLAGGDPSLGILLEYADEEQKSDDTLRRSSVTLRQVPRASPAGRVAMGFIGSGNYAGQILIPAFKAAGAELRSVASSRGMSGVHFGNKHGFQQATTDTEGLLADPGIDAVSIVTRHDSHAALVRQALETGKHVFVEKPLCLTLAELEQIQADYEALAAANRAPLLMVGFNRRFAPLLQKMKALLGGVSGPKALVMTVNAGAIPADHWTQDREVGGGRVIGEACHFIDLLRFLVGAPIVDWQKSTMDAPTADTLTILLNFADGSVGTVHYFSNGSKSFPKERLEVFAGERVLQMDNFRKLRGFGWPGFKKMNLRQQDKSQTACATAFVKAIENGGESPIAVDEIFEVSRVAIEIGRSG